MRLTSPCKIHIIPASIAMLANYDTSNFIEGHCIENWNPPRRQKPV